MTTSWIIRRKDTREVICETWEPRIISRINTAKYEAVPIVDYLAEINRAAKVPACAVFGG